MHLEVHNDGLILQTKETNRFNLILLQQKNKITGEPRFSGSGKISQHSLLRDVFLKSPTKVKQIFSCCSKRKKGRKESLVN